MSDEQQAEEWVLVGRYRVDAPIGSGGMGEVWLGYDQQLDRRVAIKLMKQPSVPPFPPTSSEARALSDASAADRERFLREIRATAGLELPGIPAVYDFGTDPKTGRIFLVMQLLLGQSLSDLIAERDHTTDPMPVSWAAATAAQIASTLVDVHRVDVVHRDIKPSNLMVSANGLVKILDFGVAILQGARALPKLTQIGKTVGSPPYMSPEQVLGNPVGPAADVYGLGCVLFELIVGTVPYTETATRSYQDHHVNTTPPSLRSLRPDVPADLDDLVRGMLAKSATERPDADAVYEALLPLVQSGPSSGPRESDPRRPFLRPLAPTPRGSGSKSPSRAPQPSIVPLTFDEFLDVHERAAQLIQDSQLPQAVDLLGQAVERAAHDPRLELEAKIELATALFLADEFGRAAAIIDAIRPALTNREDAQLLQYYAGMSHAEIGEVDAAIDYLTAFIGDADATDPLYRDATYQLGMMLPTVGRTSEGLRHLESLRVILIAAYGSDSVHVSTVDRRIAQIRDQNTDR